jgi:hypothetical protein
MSRFQFRRTKAVEFLSQLVEADLQQCDLLRILHGILRGGRELLLQGRHHLLLTGNGSCNSSSVKATLSVSASSAALSRVYEQSMSRRRVFCVSICANSSNFCPPSTSASNLCRS